MLNFIDPADTALAARYLADCRAKSKTVTQFQTQQPSMADNPNGVAYNKRFAEGLRKAGLPE
jgi:hypothetical protein